MEVGVGRGQILASRLGFRYAPGTVLKAHLAKVTLLSQSCTKFMASADPGGAPSRAVGSCRNLLCHPLHSPRSLSTSSCSASSFSSLGWTPSLPGLRARAREGQEPHCLPSRPRSVMGLKVLAVNLSPALPGQPALPGV